MIVRIIVAETALLLVLGACTSQGPTTPDAAGASRTQSRDGVSIEVPAGWHSARAPLANISNPREVLTIATHQLRAGGNKCAQVPENAMEDMRPNDLLVSIQERRGQGWEFVERPSDLRTLATDDRSDGNLEIPLCMSRDDRKEVHMWWLPFEDSDRRFYALVVIGNETTEEQSTQLWNALNTLSVAS